MPPFMYLIPAMSEELELRVCEALKPFKASPRKKRGGTRKNKK
jgi:hypothetical protein